MSTVTHQGATKPMHHHASHTLHGLLSMAVVAGSALAPIGESLRNLGIFCGGAGSLIFAVLGAIEKYEAHKAPKGDRR